LAKGEGGRRPVYDVQVGEKKKRCWLDLPTIKKREKNGVAIALRHSRKGGFTPSHAGGENGQKGGKSARRKKKKRGNPPEKGAVRKKASISIQREKP